MRYAPSLAKKPFPLKEKTPEASTKKIDPFDDVPADLLVAHVPAASPTHKIVLNKFPIIDNHFLLATIPNLPQTHLLDEDDLGLTYQCLKEWARGSSREASDLFAFFNSGTHSGASQPHRHVQFIPVEDMEAGMEHEWSVLADKIVLGPSVSDTGELSFFRTHRDLPFQHFGVRLPPNAPPALIRQLYLNLYEACLNAAREYSEENPDELQLEEHEDGSLPISYNLAMTTRSMVMLPRRREGWDFPEANGKPTGYAALNGTTLAGTVLTKDEAMFSRLQNPEALSELLLAIGIPPSLRRIHSTGQL